MQMVIRITTKIDSRRAPNNQEGEYKDVSKDDHVATSMANQPSYDIQEA